MRELTLNRPVHLAGRDAYFESAVKLLRGDLMNVEVSERLEKCRSVTALVQLALEHADFALRGVDSSREEKLFVQFLGLVLDSAQALVVMTKHEHLLLSDRALLNELLGQNSDTADRSAAEHRHLAQSLLKETVQLIEMAEKTFQMLKDKTMEEFGKDDSKARYQRAYESFQKPRA
jgi:hypothetical protein